MRVAVPVFLALALGASVASADPAADRAVASQLYGDATAALARHDFAAARSALAQAHALVPSDPEILWNLAVAEYGLQRYVEACGHIRERLRLPGVREADREQASELLARMAGQVGHIHVTAPAGSIVVLDGNRVDHWDDPIEVTPAAHELSARAGDKLKTVTVTPAPGEQVFADLTPEGISTAPSSTAEGPGAFRAPEPVPPAPAPAAHGSNAVRIAVVASTGAAAVAAVVVGGVFVNAAIKDRDRARNGLASCFATGSTPCTDGHSAAQQAQSRGGLSEGFFIGGGALAAVALASWFALAPRSSTTGALWLLPAASPGGGGIAAGGTF